MRIAVLGVGAIGSTFADALARAGHDVTAIARGARLAQLRVERAIVHSDGTRTPVEVAAELDPQIAYDLVLVTVLFPQVEAVLPALVKSAARRVMFMFNTFDPIAPLRDAVGAERFCFGFPGGVFSLLVDGKITRTIRAGTTVDRAEHARMFTEAGIPTVTANDMHAWLRSHAAFVAPLMAMSVVGRAVTWSEARRFADAHVAAFALVRGLGQVIEPAMVATMAKLPRSGLGFLYWAMSRTKMSRDLAKLGATEAQMLLGQMATAARAGGLAALAEPLLAIRP